MSVVDPQAADPGLVPGTRMRPEVQGNGNSPQDVWNEFGSRTRQRLAQAAVEAFAQSGFHGTTTRQIASMAHMSPAALYTHFGSKAEVLAEICMAGHRSALRTLRDGLEAGGEDPAKSLREGLIYYTRWHAENSQLARVIWRDLDYLPEDAAFALRPIRMETTDCAAQVLRRGLDAGLFVVADVDVVLRVIFAVAIDASRPRGATAGYSAQELAESFVDLLLKLITV